jgi:hypothetical protein
MGGTRYGGRYRSAVAGQTILINPKSGRGDVVADIEGESFVAECKGGIINSKHAGHLSRLRKGLCEAIGLSLSVPLAKGRRQFAVVPRTSVTETLAGRIIERAKAAGVEIALVDGLGNVFDVVGAPS